MHDYLRSQVAVAEAEVAIRAVAIVAVILAAAAGVVVATLRLVYFLQNDFLYFLSARMTFCSIISAFPLFHLV